MYFREKHFCPIYRSIHVEDRKMIGVQIDIQIDTHQFTHTLTQTHAHILKAH